MPAVVHLPVAGQYLFFMSPSLWQHSLLFADADATEFLISIRYRTSISGPRLFGRQVASQEVSVTAAAMLRSPMPHTGTCEPLDMFCCERDAFGCKRLSSREAKASATADKKPHGMLRAHRV